MIFGISVKPGAGKGLAFGVVWTLLSLPMMAWALVGLWKNTSGITWRTAPCVLERFEIASDVSRDPVFTADLLFRYQWDGKEYTGTRLWPEANGSDEYDDISRILNGIRTQAARYDITGVRTECRVNPSNPALAALQPPQFQSWTILAGVLFAGFLLTIGLGMVRDCLHQGPAHPGILFDHDPSRPPAILYPTFGLFLFAGLLLLGGLVAPITWMRMRSQSWQSTKADVVWSERITRLGSKNRRVSYPCTLFRYEHEGVEYYSSRYDLIYSNHSPGPRVGQYLSCFVDPARPWMAAVERDLGRNFWFGLVVGGVSTTASVMALRWLHRSRRTLKT